MNEDLKTLLAGLALTAMAALLIWGDAATGYQYGVSYRGSGAIPLSVFGGCLGCCGTPTILIGGVALLIGMRRRD